MAMHSGLVKWQKGQSGNPSGRAKANPDVLEIARAATPDAIRKAIALTKHKDPRVALKAIEIVLNRALGLPRQAIDLNDLTDRPAIIIAEPLDVTEWAKRFAPKPKVIEHEPADD